MMSAPRPQPFQRGCFGVRCVLWRRDCSLSVNRGSLVGSYRLAGRVALSGTGASLLWRKSAELLREKCRTCDRLYQHRGRSIGGSTMFILQGALIVESGDVISGAVIDGQFAFSSGGVWGAIVESGGTLVSAEAISGAIALAPGAIAIGTVLSGGVMGVGGVAIDTLDDGLEFVIPGAVAS